MDSVRAALGTATDYPWLRFLAAIVVIISLILIIRYIIYTIYERATPPNIKAIETKQKDLLADRWMGITQKRQGLGQGMMEIPEEQRLLINAQILTARLTGYLGPYYSGVFSEDSAVQLALAGGARCLVLEIDYQDNNYAPVLVYRDGWGLKQSLNAGDLNKVAKSIAARAFNSANDGVPPSLANDPLLVVLYFVRTPSQVNEPKAYMKFLGAVAEQLAPLRDRLLATTPQGDFRRQALESQLFFQPFQIFNGRIIMLTNADTTGFRKLEVFKLQNDFGPAQDLDFMIHCRLYSRESPSPFGITMSPEANKKPAAVVTSYGYWLMTPPDRQKDAYESTKQAWTLAMPPVATESSQPKEDDLKKMFENYGVHSIPLCLFEKKEITDLWVGEGKPFGKAGWFIKPELLRYIPPKPIPIQKAFPQSDSGGGTVISPSLGPGLSDPYKPTAPMDFFCPYDSTISKHNNVTICKFKKPVMLPPNIVTQVPQFKNTGVSQCISSEQFKANNPPQVFNSYYEKNGAYNLLFCNILEDVIKRNKPYKVFWQQ